MTTPSTNTPPTNTNTLIYKKAANKLFVAALIVNPITLGAANILLNSAFERLDIAGTNGIIDPEYNSNSLWVITVVLVSVGLFMLYKSRTAQAHK